VRQIVHVTVRSYCSCTCMLSVWTACVCVWQTALLYVRAALSAFCMMTRVCIIRMCVCVAMSSDALQNIPNIPEKPAESSPRVVMHKKNSEVLLQRDKPTSSISVKNRVGGGV